MAAILANYAYAEGVWTPVIQAVTPPTGITYATQIGRYTRVGNFMMAALDLTLSSIGTGGAGFIAIGGLPIPVAEGYPSLYNCIGGTGLTVAGSAVTTLFLIPIGGQPAASIVINNLSAGTVFLDYGALTATSRINGTIFYNVT